MSAKDWESTERTQPSSIAPPLRVGSTTESFMSASSARRCRCCRAGRFARSGPSRSRRRSRRRVRTRCAGRLGRGRISRYCQPKRFQYMPPRSRAVSGHQLEPGGPRALVQRPAGIRNRCRGASTCGQRPPGSRNWKAPGLGIASASTPPGSRLRAAGFQTLPRIGQMLQHVPHRDHPARRQLGERPGRGIALDRLDPDHLAQVLAGRGRPSRSPSRRSRRRAPHGRTCPPRARSRPGARRGVAARSGRACSARRDAHARADRRWAARSTRPGSSGSRSAGGSARKIALHSSQRR